MSRLDPQSWSTAPRDGPGYPRRPGHVFGSATSREGAERIARKSETLEQFVESVLRIAGPAGLTDFEIQAAAEREGIHSVMRARRATLYARGAVVESGRFRPSPVSGIRATVWVLREFAE